MDNEKNGKLRRRKKSGGFVLLFLCILWAGLFAVGKTAAFIMAETAAIENRFLAAKVSCETEEETAGEVKTSIVVKNTGTTPVYVRIKLVSYRVNEKGERIGGQTEIPAFELGAGWRKSGNDTYYYQYPIAVSADEEYLDRSGNLIAKGSQIGIKQYSEEEGGGRQIIEAIAEAIQSHPSEAVNDAWPEEMIDWLASDMAKRAVQDTGRK